MVRITTDELRNLISDQPEFECKISYHKLAKYNVDEIIARMYNSRDEITRILDKVAFEAEATFFIENKKKKNG